MTLRQVFEFVQIEISKEEAPALLLEEFNFYANRAVNNYVRRVYEGYDTNQKSTDNIQVLKGHAVYSSEFRTNAYGDTNRGTFTANGTEIAYDTTDFTAQTADFTAAIGGNYAVDTSTGAVEVTLPAGVTNGDRIMILHTAGSNDITITPDGTQTSDTITANGIGQTIALEFCYLTDVLVGNWESTLYKFIDGTILYTTNNNITKSTPKVPTDYLISSTPTGVGVSINTPSQGDLQKAPYYITKKIVGDYNTNAGSATYEIKLPQNYYHLLNCVVEYHITTNFKCYNKGNKFKIGAKRVSSDFYAGSLANVFTKPDPLRPYYFISNSAPSQYAEKNGDINGPDESQEYVGGNRYGHVEAPVLQIRYGSDDSVFSLVNLYIDYIKTPRRLRLTQDQFDVTLDTSQVLEFPDHICDIIAKDLVTLILEKTSDPRVQSHDAVNRVIPNQPQP